MARQAGLGRSLRDVIESLTPVEPEIAAHVQVDASELLERLDELLADVRELRDRVHQLASLLGDDVDASSGPKKSKKAKMAKKGKKKHEARNA